MTWTPHSDLSTIILLSADVASIYISLLFFSNRVRRWSYRKRWGSLPVVSPQAESIPRTEKGYADDLCGGLTRLQHVSLLRNPFEPRLREGPNATAPQVQRDGSRRPNFRRSTVLQQRIAQHATTAADYAPASPQWQREALSAILPDKGGKRHSDFDLAFTFHHGQESQPA